MLFVEIFLLTICCQNAFGVTWKENEKTIAMQIPSLIRNIVTDYNQKDAITHDVVLFRFRHNIKSARNVSDMYSRIVKSIASFNPVVSLPLTEIEDGFQKRKASFVIIVSDVNEPVSSYNNEYSNNKLY